MSLKQAKRSDLKNHNNREKEILKKDLTQFTFFDITIQMLRG
jgi:hypothetical protein